MPHKVLVNQNNTDLPNGYYYQNGQVVVLTDEEFSHIAPNAFTDGQQATGLPAAITGSLTDLGEIAPEYQASAARVDASSGTTAGSYIVTDTHSTAADVGAPVSGTGIPAGTYVIPGYTPGTNLFLSKNATATGTVSVTLASH